MMEITLDEAQWDAIVAILKEQPYYIAAELIESIEAQMEDANMREIADAFGMMASE
jgi:hypothetical protein